MNINKSILVQNCTFFEVLFVLGMFLKSSHSFEQFLKLESTKNFKMFSTRRFLTSEMICRGATCWRRIASQGSCIGMANYEK